MVFYHSLQFARCCLVWITVNRTRPPLPPGSREAAQANDRADLIKRLFAVAISVGAATTLYRMSWVQDGRPPCISEYQQLLILVAAESDDLEKLVLRFCIRPVDGAFELLAIMDIRARSISFTTRPRRPYGPPDHERAGETFSPSLFLTRRPRRESQLLLPTSAAASRKGNKPASTTLR